MKARLVMRVIAVVALAAPIVMLAFLFVPACLSVCVGEDPALVATNPGPRVAGAIWLTALLLWPVLDAYLLAVAWRKDRRAVWPIAAAVMVVACIGSFVGLLIGAEVRWRVAAENVVLFGAIGAAAGTALIVPIDALRSGRPWTSLRPFVTASGTLQRVGQSDRAMLMLLILIVIACLAFAMIGAQPARMILDKVSTTV
jgi:hypothetical protein